MLEKKNQSFLTSIILFVMLQDNKLTITNVFLKLANILYFESKKQQKH